MHSLPESGKTAIIIPVFNHARTVGVVVQQCQKLHLPVIVVNDGSTDATAAVLKNIATIRVIHHSTNRGKGAALLTGFQAAAGQARRAVSIDADGQHDPREIPRLLAAAQDDEPTLVIGARHNMASAMAPWSSRYGRRLSNFWVRMAGAPHLGDTQSGFRLYPLPEVLHLDVQARRFEYELEVLIRAHRQGLRIREVPVTVTYPAGRRRVSHFRPLKDFMRNSRMFGRMILQRMIPNLQKVSAHPKCSS